MSPRLTEAEAKQLGAKRAQPVKRPDELLAVFVPRKLMNPLNGSLSGAHWTKRRSSAKEFRDQTNGALLMASMREADGRWPEWTKTEPAAPKRVTFHATVHNAFDDDNLRAALKPARDSLKDMGVINDDRDSAGHEFLYSQEAKRKAGTVYGVEIRVSLRERNV